MERLGCYLRPEQCLRPDITFYPHLPSATDYADRHALRDVRDRELAQMLAECAHWSDDMERLREAITTPAAMVLWRVHVEIEEQLVAAAVVRVKAEIAVRLSGLTADAVPAPGEGPDLMGGKDGSGTHGHASGP